MAVEGGGDSGDILKPRRLSLLELYEMERKRRKECREAGVSPDQAVRSPARVHQSRPGIDQSIPESERREREPGEEG